MKKLCKIRELQKAINLFEQGFEASNGLCLNQAMILCSLSEGEALTPGQLTELLGLKHSHISKLIKQTEEKALIKRSLGKEDKRQMYFCLSVKGQQALENFSCNKIIIPEALEDAIKAFNK